MSPSYARFARNSASALITGLFLSGTALAQYAPMDMSWAMQSQMQAYNYGQAAANAAAMQYLRHMQQLRAAGYTGPSLPTGVTNESLRASINGANEAAQDYIHSQSRNSDRRAAAVDNYSWQAIRGCRPAVDQYGRWGYAC